MSTAARLATPGRTRYASAMSLPATLDPWTSDDPLAPHGQNLQGSPTMLFQAPTVGEA